MESIILITMFFVLLLYFLLVRAENLEIERKNFKHPFFDTLHLISFVPPFSILLKEDRDLKPKEMKIEEKLHNFNLNKYFNLRSFLALRFLSFFSSIFLFVIVTQVIKIVNSEYLAHRNPLLIIPFLLLSLLPDLYLKRTEKKYNNFCYDEIVVLQLFMLSLVRSNATNQEILYSFAKMNTFHKETFMNAYRISLRNKEEALSMLEQRFENSPLGNSFNTLRNMHEYSKSTSIKILEVNLRKLEETSMLEKSKGELAKFSFAQVSMIIPFSISIMLGALPLIYYGTNTIVQLVTEM